jgi:serine/threonine-protein kinase
MRSLILAIVMLLLAVEAADARKRGHHYRYYHQPAQALVVPPEAHGSAERFNRALRRSSAVVPLAALIPPRWQQQAPDPSWNGKRFVSPDGSSWFAVYKSPVDRSVSEHMKEVVFATDDETLTHVRGERTWIEVSGFKGDRIFYRKAIVACAGKTWHHVAFEYPAELKTTMDRFVGTAANALDTTQLDCEELVSEQTR